MGSERNRSGDPLAGSAWLAKHHQAKLEERRAFARRLAELNPHSILDLGCAGGLWLELLHEIMPPTCRLVGVDRDEFSLAEAERRSWKWDRSVQLVCMDVEKQAADLPWAEMALAFNVSGYINDLARLFSALYELPDMRHVAVRQYDGAALRFGPMSAEKRCEIDASLLASMSGSHEIRHYDMDRVILAIDNSSYRVEWSELETFFRRAPFPEDFMDYLVATIEWTSSHVSENARLALGTWDVASSSAYFYEVDFVALLSKSTTRSCG